MTNSNLIKCVYDHTKRDDYDQSPKVQDNMVIGSKKTRIQH
jgi:hypothetical protein